MGDENLKFHCGKFREKYFNIFEFRFPQKNQTNKTDLQKIKKDYEEFYDNVMNEIMNLTKNGIRDFEHFLFNLDESSCRAEQRNKKKSLICKESGGKNRRNDAGKVVTTTFAP